MDGNGRWARQRGQARLYGHGEGAESVRACCEQAVRRGVRYLSLFAFSEENWNRDKDEVEGLMSLMLKSIHEEIDTFHRNGIRFRVIGNTGRLAPHLKEAIHDAEAQTAGYDRLTLIIMLSYSGKWDILQAAGRYAEEVLRLREAGEPVPPLDEELFSAYLSTAGIPEPDLMIRTSGEVRISNYMLWQCAYTEFYFTDTLWPDFREEEFDRALAAYEERDRRFGLVKK